MERVELILYATPTGQLADQCAHFFRQAHDLGPTEAQTYPPHCSLTGFFRRHRHDIDGATAELVAVLAGHGIGPDGRVEADEVVIDGLLAHGSWVGLGLRSGRLERIAADFATAHRHDPTTGDDPIRLKSWLHLSLAYGEVLAGGPPSPPPVEPAAFIGPYRQLATTVIDPTLRTDWEVALWQRHPGGRWERLSPSRRA